MRLDIAPLEPATLPVLPFDVVWNQAAQIGDAVIATDPSQGGVGGFQAANPLLTAALLLLGTDARIPRRLLKLGLGGDRRGWPGDGVDVEDSLGEAQLGSYFWAMFRDVLNDGVAANFVAEGRRALQPLIRQGVCSKIDVSVAALDPPQGLLELAYALYPTDGREALNGTYRPLLNRAGGV